MRKEKLFTRAERKAAMWALLAAVAVTTAGVAIEQVWSRPPLGLYGAMNGGAALPGVIDAQPLTSAAGL